MLTPTLTANRKGIPLYEQLYAYIKSEIEQGDLVSGERLPSKRKLASHLNISQSTVENAYAQLVAEGYVNAISKKGYYIGLIEPMLPEADMSSDLISNIGEDTGKKEIGDVGRVTAEVEAYKVEGAEQAAIIDMKTNTVDKVHFPYATWHRLMRENIREGGQGLLEQSFPQGNERLRKQIARYLREYRAIDVHPEQVILGAGMEHLLGLVIDLLPEAVFAYENPGYGKVVKVLETRGVATVPVPVDEAGLCVDVLRESSAGVVFTTPACHFPLSITMSFPRRQKLLAWAQEKAGSYIIEDDYDSEFRFSFKPVPSLHSLDRQDKVIYINTFANTLAPSLRIAYMVLPPLLTDIYMEKLSFYSCSVSEFEQQILSSFIGGGYYERHLSRMRKLYRSRRDVLIQALSPLGGNLSIRGQESGLHLLLQMDGKRERELVRCAEAVGVRLYPISDFYTGKAHERKMVLSGYASLSSEKLAEVGRLLCEAWG